MNTPELRATVKKSDAQAEVAEANARQLAAKLECEPRWQYMTALAWIGLRDTLAVARLLPTRPAFASLWGPGSCYDWLAEILGATPEVIDRWPMQALLSALRSGSVKAYGRRNGLEELAPIAPEQWDDLDFIDAPHENLGDDYVIRADWKSGALAGTYWSGVRFDRKSLVATFRRSRAPALDPDEGAKQLIGALEAELKSAGFFTQSRAEEIARNCRCGLRRDRVREIAADLSGHRQRGPIPGANKKRLELRRIERGIKTPSA